MARALFAIGAWTACTAGSATGTTDPDPCAAATENACGKAATGPFCSLACAWNASTAACTTVDNYPLPSNSSVAALVGAASPLAAVDWLTISWYGDSITWLGLYEGIIADALQAGAGTQKLHTRLINQGVDGGTVKDLVLGYSPWGHLDPFVPQSNITLAATLQRDAPDIVGIQIGINDVWQSGPSCGARCSNATEFARVLRDEVITPAQAIGARVYLASVSTIYEKLNGSNEYDGALTEFAAAAEALAATVGIPFVNLRAVDEAYIAAYNCMDLDRGVLTYDGVHPNQPRGATNLADRHAAGILAAAAARPLDPRPLPHGYAYGGRLFLTANESDTDLGGIAGADAICTAAAPGGPVPAKALLVDEDGCSGAPCRRASLTPFAGDAQVDWALAPHAVYMQADNVTIAGMTDARGLLAFPLFFNAMPCLNQASGMHANWTTVAGGTCGSWTRGAKQGAPLQQSIGWACAVDDGLLYGGSDHFACDSNKIVCATVAA